MKYLMMLLLPLAAACGAEPEPKPRPRAKVVKPAPPQPKTIQQMLDETVIDVAALEAQLAIPAESVRIITPASTEAGFSLPWGEWRVENVGTKPLWIPARDLVVHSQLIPLVPINDCGTYRRGIDLSNDRPQFNREDWARLEPGESIRISTTLPQPVAGDHSLWVSISQTGQALCWQAREFNERRSIVPPEEIRSATAATAWVNHVVLPEPRTWREIKWHDLHSLHLVPEGRNRFVWTVTMETPRDRTEPLPLDGFVIDERRDVAYAGPMTAVDFRTEWLERPVPGKAGTLRVRTVYLLPQPLSPDRHRLLVRAQNVREFFVPAPELCCNGGSEHRGSVNTIASAWIPFEVGSELAGK